MLYTKIEEIPSGTRFQAVPKGTKQRVRCLKETDDSVFIFLERSRRYGRRYTKTGFDLFYTAIEPKKQEDVWKNNIFRAIRLMESSGLWPDVLEFFRNLSRMSYDDLQEIRQIWGLRCDNTTTREYRNALWEPLAAKYPSAFAKGNNSDSEWAPATFYVSEIADCKLKTMYFGTGINKAAKENIKNALDKKEDFSCRYEAGYDVSFNYSAEKNKAWYAEEYRGCGNGHYYIALDHSTALFIEND